MKNFIGAEKSESQKSERLGIAVDKNDKMCEEEEKT